MKIKRMAVAALAAIVLVGCDGGTTAPSDPQFVTTITRISAVNPRTGKLEVVPQHQIDNVMASIASTSGSQVATIIPANAPGFSTGKAGGITYTYTDSAKNTHHAIFLYAGAGPPTAVQSYVNKRLVSVTTLTWTRVSGGYYNSKSVMQVLNPSGAQTGQYTLTGTVEQATTPCNPKVDPKCGPVQTVMRTPTRVERAVGLVALAIANACVPTDAYAQFYFAQCSEQWAMWAIAFFAMYGSALADFSVPGAAAIAYSTWGAAVYALKQLVDCMALHDQTASTQGPSAGGAGSGGGGADMGDKICEMGSYAAHCTTAFTL